MPCVRDTGLFQNHEYRRCDRLLFSVWFCPFAGPDRYFKCHEYGDVSDQNAGPGICGASKYRNDA